MDVFFYEAFEEEQHALASAAYGKLDFDCTRDTIQEHAETRRRRPPAPLISVRTQSNIPVEWAPHLKGILSRSTGYDHLIDYMRQTQAALSFGYLPRYCIRAVAEQAMLHWTALLRKLPKQLRQFNCFGRDGITGSECSGNTLLVTGVGNIGHEIVKIGEVLGMRVLGVDIRPRFNDVTYVSPQEGIETADVIVCAMNLTSANRAYFNYERLSGAPRHPIFVNIARGELSPLQDLLRLLEEGVLGGVGLDVFEDELHLANALRHGDSSSQQMKIIQRLLERDDVILTPHNAFNTREAVQRKASQSIEQILYFMKHGHFLWPVPMKEQTDSS